MELTVKISCDNAAFGGDDPGPELARILYKLAEDCGTGCAVDLRKGLNLKLRDINGNLVGAARMT